MSGDQRPSQLALEQLRALPLFRDLCGIEFACVAEQASEVHLETDAVLFSEGEGPVGLFLLYEGAVEVTKRIGEQDVVLSCEKPGAFLGEIAVLTGEPHTATVRATEPSQLIRLEPSIFDAMKADSLAGALLSTMARRLRNTEMVVHQHQRLAALGKLSAGLAHELNNPASANLRAARQLPQTLMMLQDVMLGINGIACGPTQIAYLRGLQAELMERARRSVGQRRDPLALSDLQEALAGWITAQNLPNGWRVAPALAEAGVTVAELDTLHETVGTAALPDALTWLDGTLTVLSLLRTIEHSATRITDLTGAVKVYTHRDMAPVQELDVHDGLEATLLVLGYKLKGVTIARSFDRDLPKITANGGELNQVWTNLIDNAVDAMGGRGRLSVRTWREGSWLAVEIGDDGPGISAEVQAHMFEPFFTTKEPGKGTGLGLDIVRRIVLDQHRGQIRYTSQPGDTRFTVLLPIGLEAAG